MVFALSAMAMVSSTLGEDRPWSRAYRGELYGIVQILGGDETTGYDGYVEGDTGTTPVYGAGVGLNLSDHLNVNTEIMLGWMDLEQTWPSDPNAIRTDDNTQVWLWNVNVDYNILKGRLTPLITGGIGAFGINGDYFGEINFSYNVGAGVRWDISDRFALRILYRSTWMEINHADDPFQFDGVTASAIWMLK